MSAPRVYVNRIGERVSSPNTKEQLCEAVEYLTEQLTEARAMVSELLASERAR